MDEYTQLIFDLILNGHEFNYPEIALGLAKIDPKLFCQLAKLDTTGTVGSVYDRYHRLIHDNIMAGQVIQAIKDLRAETGWGLKESKDFVDEYRRKVGRLPTPGW